MHVLQIYNRQRSMFGGEEKVITAIDDMLERYGHTTSRYERSSHDIGGGILSRIGAAVNGVYSLRSRRELTQILASDRPDIVHFHNIYPLLSPSVFDACRAAGVPAVMSIHSHILTCPNWFHVRNNTFCEKCMGGRAYWCFLTDCRKNLPESAAYALRSQIAHWFGMFRRPGLLLLPVSLSLAKRLMETGCCPDRIEVVPNQVDVPETAADPGKGTYVAFAGRLSYEKGIDTLIEASRRTGLPVRIAGDGPIRADLESSAPQQVTFLGQLDSQALDEMYRGARFIVVPSITCETFGLVAAEAMARGIPVIVSDLGALTELAGDGDTGLRFTPGDPLSLAHAMTRLWDDPETLRRMGKAARNLIRRRYTEAIVYERLMEAYRKAGAQAGEMTDA